MALTVPDDLWNQLAAGHVDAVCLGSRNPGGQTYTSGLVFPGAFNPLHHGHRRMAELAGQLTGLPVEFEISVVNVDKPPLTHAEAARRAAQFRDDEVLWLTRAATFVEKSQIFPGATFVVGADTLARIAQPKYYGGSPQRCQQAIERIAANGCRLLVFGRLVGGRFMTLDQLQLPEALRRLCQGVPEQTFREDVSSTELRRR